MPRSERRRVAELRRTLEIMHALATIGIVEQAFDDQGMIVWRAKGSQKRFDAVMRALRA